MKPDPVGLEQNGEQHQGGQNEESFQSERIIASEVHHDLREDANAEEINSSKENRDRALQYRLGRINIHLEMSDSKKRAQN